MLETILKRMLNSDLCFAKNMLPAMYFKEKYVSDWSDEYFSVLVHLLYIYTSRRSDIVEAERRPG